MMNNEFYENLDKMIPEVKCELIYNKDYELLIAVMLSAQCTDKRVNEATKELFAKYDIEGIANAKEEELIPYIRPLGNYHNKIKAAISICQSLLKDHNGKVPNDREYLENLKGVGRKTTNVVLSILYNVPAIAVDTHVARVSKRFGFVNEEDDVLTIEQKLMNLLPEDKWNKIHLQMVLFGRYICTSRSPKCSECLFTNCPSRDKEKNDK